LLARKNTRKAELKMARRKWTNDEIIEYRKMHGAFFYYNKEDSNLFVPKYIGVGITINWANPLAWIVIIAILLLILIHRFLL
jgi:uncharacterized membrane protein